MKLNNNTQEKLGEIVGLASEVVGYFHDDSNLAKIISANDSTCGSTIT